MLRTPRVLARWLLVIGLLSCATTKQKPPTPSFKPVEEGDKEPTPPPSPTPAAPQGEGATPTASAPSAQPGQAADPQAPVQATAEGEIECRSKKECKKLKGKPGKGMAWSCVEGVCMAEGKVKKEKKKRRKK